MFFNVSVRQNWEEMEIIHSSLLSFFLCLLNLKGMYIKSTYDGLHVITGTTEGVRASQC